MVQVINFLFGIIETIVGTVLEVGFDFIKSIVSANRKTEFNADFLPSYALLSSHNKGFCLTGNKSLSIEDSYKNCIVYGGSGAGKSSVILIPSILRMIGKSALCINDPSGEIAEKVTGALLKAGYEIQALNYSNPLISEGYNPLERAKTTSDIQKISKLIVINALGSKSNDPFWSMSAESLISLFIRYLIYYEAKEYRNLANVLHLLNTFSYKPEAIDKIVVLTNDAQLIAEYKAFIAYGDKTLMSIVATCRAALSLFSDPTVAAVTSQDTLSFGEFRKKRVLFIHNSVKDMRYYSVISSIFFEQFFGEIMTTLPDKKDLPIFFLIDESSSLYINSLQVAISNIRKYKSGILQIYQDYNQMIDLYGMAVTKAINANAFAKVYMPGQPIGVAEEISKTLGKFEYTDDDDKKHIRQLLSPDEVRQLNEILILCGNKPAIKTKPNPYYHQYRLKRLSQIPSYQPISKILAGTPPLIQFN